MKSFTVLAYALQHQEDDPSNYQLCIVQCGVER